jgi:nucleotide-binding universal stress UspA family protein
MSGQFKRILVPLDGSRLAEAVLPLAVALGKCLDAKIMLLHIIEEHAPHTVHGEPHLTSTQDADSYLVDIAQRYTNDVQFEQHVHGTEEHDVAHSIAAHATELGADMVALCTHGRSGPRRVVWGSIAQQVLRRVSAPVLLVRPQMPVVTSVNTLLIPLDGTPSAETALPAASEIARACDAQLYLVNVVPTVETVTGDLQAAARLTPLSTAATLNVEEEQSKNYLEQTAERLRSEGIRANALVRRGDTVPSLAEATQEAQADLVVIATHGRAGLEAMWAGSVTATLIGKVTKPVLMIRI